MKIKALLLLSIASFNMNAQNLFPIKLDNCKTDRFCLDCGDIKVTYKEQEFEKMITKLNQSLNLKGITGSVKFQVLVDSKGKGCVLSHTDKSNSPITLMIIKELNDYDKWNPAITDNKKEEKSSVNLIFIVKDNRISGQIERVDMDAFNKSFDHPRKPEIYNTNYVYKNENLKNYQMTVWNSINSDLPNNMVRHMTIDKNGIIWLSADAVLTKFDGQQFQKVEQNITDKGKYFSYNELVTDNNNVKWIYAKQNIYTYDDKTWKIYTEEEIGINSAYEILNNPISNEVFFCSDEGLTIHKEGKWSNINKDKIKELPSNRVGFAKRDSKNRLWIGTFSGTIMIDENGKATSFEKSKTILKGKCITSMDEDKNGNLYFSLYEFDRKDKEKVNNDEGIAVLYTNGTFKQFTTENSGMPFNHATHVLYDQNENVLWIATDRAGLVRFDLKDNWENYHNENSKVPTSDISTMSLDNQGNLFLATNQGLVKIERK